MRNTNKPIGILGGMGALAGAHFYNELILECQRQGAVKDDDFPEIVLHNIKPKGMNEKGITNDRLFKKDLSYGISFLNNCNVDVIYIVCNTAHIYHDYLQARSNAKIINIPKVTVASIKPYTKTVGVISSMSTKKAGLYSKHLKKYNMKEIKTTSMQQKMVDKVIGRLISGKYSTKDRSAIENIIDNMFMFGADKVILGCTELPILVNSLYNVINAGKQAIRETFKL